MKQLSQNEMLVLQGGIACAFDPTHPLANLYCGNCSVGHLIDSVMNGTFIADPVGYITMPCEA